MKILQYFQYVYPIVAIFFAFEAVRLWSEDRSKSYMLLFFAALAVFMFFFRRRFSKKFQDRQE